ncbi:MAG: hypothetical protein WBA57_17345 [Elainellaceae cyanobacterium]
MAKSSDQNASRYGAIAPATHCYNQPYLRKSPSKRGYAQIRVNVMEHPASDCCIQPFSPDCHDIQATVELLIASAPELFSLLFGRSAPHILSQLVVRSHNRFSYRYIRVAVLETEVVGLVTLIPVGQTHKNHWARILMR